MNRLVDGTAEFPALYPPRTLVWWMPGETAPDRNGPADRPYDLPDPAFLERAAYLNFAAIAECQPAAVALHDEAQIVTYGDLRERALHLAARIASATSVGAAVAVLLSDEAEVAIAMLACFAAGRVCLLLNPGNPAERTALILADSAPEALVVPEGAELPPLPAAMAVLRGTSAASAATVAAVSPAGLDQAACVIYTSGSTGQPKGIVRSQRQVLYRGLNKIQQFHVDRNDRILSLYSLTSGPGVTAMTMALTSGAELHFARIASLGARGLLAAIQQRRITIINAVPALLRMLLSLPGAREAFAGVRGIFSTSEALLRSDIEAWRQVLPRDCAVALAYGLTEGAPLAEWFLPTEPPGTEARLPVGYPVARHEYALADADGRPVPQGEVGELWARGRFLSLGEWRQGGCVPGRLLADPDDPSRFILRTGDLVRLRPDGLMEFAGRADAMVKIRGNRVEPAEIEDVLRRDPAVGDVAIVARRSDEETSLIAFVVPKQRVDEGQGAEGLHDALLQRLEQALPAYMVPARIEFIDVLPRLPGGKVDFRSLAVSAVPRQEPAGGSLARLRRLFGGRP